MSTDGDQRPPKWQAYCPDCGGKFLNIWIGGRVHCGNCSRGGVIWSPHYEHLLNLDRPGKDAAGAQGDRRPILTLRKHKSASTIRRDKERRRRHRAKRSNHNA